MCVLYLCLSLFDKFRRNVIVGFTEFFLAVPNILYTLPFMRGLAEDILYPGTRYGHGILLSLPWTFVITGLIAAIMVKFLFKHSLTFDSHLSFLL